MQKHCLRTVCLCILCIVSLTSCRKDRTYERDTELFTQAQAFIEERKYPQAIGVLSEITDNETAEDQLEQLRYLISGDYLENLQMGVAAIDRDGHVRIAVNPIYFQDKPESLEEIAGWKDIRSLSGGLCGLDALDINGNFYTIRGYSVSDDYTERNTRIRQLEPLRLLFSYNSDFSALDMVGKFCAYSQYTDYLQSDVVSQKIAGWTDIVDIVSGPDLTVVLRKDGTVDFVCADAGYASEYSDMLEWTDIVVIDGLGVTGCIAGLKSDGTVMVSHHGIGNMVNYRETEEWSGIIAVSMGFDSLLGLKRDGTVVAAGNLDAEQKNISEWTDIVAIAAGQDVHVGLKADGSIVVAGKLPNDVAFPDVTDMKDLYVPAIVTDGLQYQRD